MQCFSWSVIQILLLYCLVKHEAQVVITCTVMTDCTPDHGSQHGYGSCVNGNCIYSPTMKPTGKPTGAPTGQPSEQPSSKPSIQPTAQPSSLPSTQPTGTPSGEPSNQPSSQPTTTPSAQPSAEPSTQPSSIPSAQPTHRPTRRAEGKDGDFTTYPTGQPSKQPTRSPTSQPTGSPSYRTCPAGFFGNGSGPCTACAIGKYKSIASGRIDSPGSIQECLSCPNGKSTSLSISPNYGSVLVQASVSTDACNLCMPGFYGASPKTSGCTVCPANTYKNQYGNWAMCNPCPPGTIAKNTTSCINVVPNYAYAPNEAVSVGSNFPHLQWDKFFQTTQLDAAFNVSNDSPILHPSFERLDTWLEWVWHFAPFPLLLALTGWGSVVVFQLFMTLRLVHPCMTCGPNADDLEDFPYRVVQRRRRIHIFFLVSFVLAVLVEHAVWSGYFDLEVAEGLVRTSLSSMIETFNILKNSPTDIKTSLETLSLRMSTSACYTQAMRTTFNARKPAALASAATISSLASSVMPYLVLAQTKIHGDYLAIFRPYLIIVFFTIAILLTVGYFVATLIPSKRLMYVLIGVSELFVLGLTGCVVVELLLVMAVGDFCIKPLAYLSEKIMGSRSARGVMSYYTSCSRDGISPFQASISSINTALYGISDALSANANAGCSTEISLSINSLSKSLAQNLAMERIATGCSPIYSELEKFLLQGVCDHGFSGFFKSFLVHFIVNGLILFLTISAALLYPYFGKAWTMTRRSIHAAEILERELAESGRKVVIEIVPVIGGRIFGNSPSKVGVNPTLQMLDHDPFRDPLDALKYERVRNEQKSEESLFY